MLRSISRGAARSSRSLARAFFSTAPALHSNVTAAAATVAATLQPQQVVAKPVVAEAPRLPPVSPDIPLSAVSVYRRVNKLTPFSAALNWMETLVEAKTPKVDPYPRDVLFVVQHAPVYTLGKAATLDNVLFDTSSYEMHRLERGGEVTYHGPGQLTVYPILSLERHKKDLHWYVHKIEDTVTAVLARHGIPAAGDAANPGVWVNDGSAKVAALGIKVRRWVTMHGFAVNVEPVALEGFHRIVPCGIKGKSVASLHGLLEQQREERVQYGAMAVAEAAAVRGTLPPPSGVSLEAVADDIVAEFARVFNVQCVEDPALTAFYDSDPTLMAFDSKQFGNQSKS